MQGQFEQRKASQRLRRAMECGYLNARCNNGAEVLRDYGRWCWQMGLPMVWFEPRTPRSRLSRVHLDLFTTPASLSVQGYAELIAVSARYVPAEYATVSFFSGVWDHVRLEDAAELARAVVRTVRRGGNYELAARPAASPKATPFALERRAS